MKEQKDGLAARPAADAAQVADRPRPPIALLIALSAAGPFALNAAVPAMPAMARGLETSYGVIQLVLTLYLAAVAVAQLFLGPLSDRFGRRPVMIAGLGLFGLGTLVCAAAPSAIALIAGRIIQAAGGSAGLVLSRAIVRDLHGRDRSASLIGYITMAMVMAPMIAPAIGGYLAEFFGWRAIFWAMLGAALPLVLVTLRYLHETHQSEGAASSVSGFLAGGLTLLKLREFWGYSLNMGFASGMFFAFVAGAPFIVVEIMGRPASEYGLYFIATSTGYMFGNFLSGRFASRIGPQRMIVAGSCLALVGLSLLWLFAGSGHPISIFGPMAIIAVSNGLTLPSATASAISVRPQLAGAAAGFSGSFQIGIGAAMTLVVGTLQGATSLPMIAAMTACGILAILGFAMARVGAGRA